MQGIHSRQGPPAMLQHTVSMDVSEGNSTLETLLEEDGRGEPDIAELHRANEVAGSVHVQPSTAPGSETDALLSSEVTQQATSRHETTADNLTAAKSSLGSGGSAHAPASAMLHCNRAASMAHSTMLEGSAPIGLVPAQPSSPEHDSLESETDLHQSMQASARPEQSIYSCPAADKSYAGVPDDVQLPVIPSAAGFNQLKPSSSKSSPLALCSVTAVADSMSTPKADISGRIDPALHDALPHVPESRHSKGLQQLWNSVAHTSLTVPSPCSMASKHSKLHRWQVEEQSHQRVLVPEMTTRAEGTSQASAVSTMSGSAASEVTERTTAYSGGSRSMPMGGAESPHR